MIVTIAGFKGGIGKTTAAVHLAAYLNEHAPAVLVDGDPNRSATGWARRGHLPFPVVGINEAMRVARKYEHVVVDSKARPEPGDLEEMAQGSDLLVLPTPPATLALDALVLTVDQLAKFGARNFKILLTIIPPAPNREGDEARRTIEEEGLPIFGAGIRRLKVNEKAAQGGVTVREVSDPRALDAWSDYEAWGKEVLS